METAASAETLQDGYRSAMRRLGSTVAIITAGRSAACTGMAATAIMSVTVDPPTLMVAVNRSASLAPFLQEGDLFRVNLLAQRHADLVPTFSGVIKGPERFAQGKWILGDSPPLLRDAAASLLCRKVSTMDFSTHLVFAGEVIEAVNHPQIDPLIWVDGAMARTDRL